MHYGERKDSHDHSHCPHRHHYETKREAKRAAREMGMSGAHRMSCDGKSMWMPGQSHSDYMDYIDGRGGLGIDIPGL